MDGLFILAAEWWLKWVLGLMGSAVLAGFRCLHKKQKTSEKRQQALENGMVAMLRDRIVQAYYHYHARNTVTLHGLENIKGMYAAYKTLGGNGIVDKLVEDLLEMEVVDD